MEVRAYSEPLELRSASKRLIGGRVVPFGLDRKITETLIERFERGSFNHQLRCPNRVAFYKGHSIHGGLHIGQGVELRDSAEGLYGEFKVVGSQLGDHWLEMAREGMIRHWSIGFTPDRERRDGGTVVYTRANLFELALVDEGAYGDLAAVETVRTPIPPLSRDVLLAKLPPARFPS